MNIQVNIASNVALYEQIANQLKDLIVSGELPEGFPLPSVRALAQELGVSIITARRAYTELEQEGYIITAPAKGSFVSHRYTERLKELGFIKLSELVDDLVYLSRALNVTQEQLGELVTEHYQYVSTHPNEKAKIVQLLRQRSNTRI